MALCFPDLSRSFSYGALPLRAPFAYYAPTINTYNALNPAPSGVARLQNVQEGINLQADLIALEDIYAKAKPLIQQTLAVVKGIHSATGPIVDANNVWKSKYGTLAVTQFSNFLLTLL